MRKLRLREVKSPAQGHRMRTWIPVCMIQNHVSMEAAVTVMGWEWRWSPWSGKEVNEGSWDRQENSGELGGRSQTWLPAFVWINQGDSNPHLQRQRKGRHRFRGKKIITTKIDNSNSTQTFFLGWRKAGQMGLISFLEFLPPRTHPFNLHSLPPFLIPSSGVLKQVAL